MLKATYAGIMFVHDQALSNQHYLATRLPGTNYLHYSIPLTSTTYHRGVGSKLAIPTYFYQGEGVPHPIYENLRQE